MSGLFAAHWESDEPREWGPGPKGVPAPEAIEWARRHATRVSVLLGDGETIYSAGEDDFFDDDLPRWPEEGMVIRARPMDSPLDGSVQEIPWQVVGYLRPGSLPDQDALTRVVSTIQRDPRVLDASAEIRAGETLVHCRLTARGMATAVITAHDLIEAAFATALPGDAVTVTKEVNIR